MAWGKSGLGVKWLGKGQREHDVVWDRVRGNKGLDWGQTKEKRKMTGTGGGKGMLES